MDQEEFPKDIKEENEEEGDGIELETEKTPVEYEAEICHLNAQILNLENSLNEMKRHNQTLLIENSQFKTANKRLSFTSKGRSCSINPNSKQSSAYQLAEILNEKNELQELNEKMINMLTEKEIENGELREQFENYQQEKTFQIDELNEKISELAEELEQYQKNEEGDYDAIDELQNQYNIYKEEMENEIRNYENKLEMMTNQNDNLNDTIIKLRAEIQTLEIENLQWLNNANQKQENHDEELLGNIETSLNELEKVKNQLRLSEETRTNTEEKYKDIINAKNKEISDLIEKKDELIKAMNNTKQELTKDNAKLLLEYGKVSKDLNNTKIKINQLQNTITDANKKIGDYKDLLDKKTKELKEINESAKKVISNKEAIISQYEDKIDVITKDKNDLIEQNKILLNQLRENQYGSLNDLLENEDKKEQAEMHENKLLNEEIKSLKETIQNQVNELVKMNLIKEQLESLKEENEKIKGELKDVKGKYEEQIKTNEYKNIQLRSSLNIQRKKTMTFQRQMSITPKDNVSKLEKQIAFLTTMKENDKKRFQEQIDKLHKELANQKVIVATQAFDMDTLIVRYRKILHRLIEECKKNGLKVNVKL